MGREYALVTFEEKKSNQWIYHLMIKSGLKQAKHVLGSGFSTSVPVPEQMEEQ